MLFSLKDSEYGRNADVQFDIADKIERAQGSDAWQDFSNNSVRFFNDLELSLIHISEPTRPY